MLKPYQDAIQSPFEDADSARLSLRNKADLFQDTVQRKCCSYHCADWQDADMSPFEAARKLLDADSARLSLGDKAELVFQDMDLVPLLIQENYVNHRPAACGNEAQQMQVCQGFCITFAKCVDARPRGSVCTEAAGEGLQRSTVKSERFAVTQQQGHIPASGWLVVPASSAWQCICSSCL